MYCSSFDCSPSSDSTKLYQPKANPSLSTLCVQNNLDERVLLPLSPSSAPLFSRACFTIDRGSFSEYSSRSHKSTPLCNKQRGAPRIRTSYGVGATIAGKTEESPTRLEEKCRNLGCLRMPENYARVRRASLYTNCTAGAHAGIYPDVESAGLAKYPTLEQVCDSWPIRVLASHATHGKSRVDRIQSRPPSLFPIIHEQEHIKTEMVS